MSAVGAGSARAAVAALLAAERRRRPKDWSRAADLLADAGDASDVLDKRVFYLSRAKRYDEAFELLATLREREPDNFLWPYMTGLSVLRPGALRGGAALVPRGVEAEPEAPEELVALGERAQQIGAGAESRPPAPAVSCGSGVSCRRRPKSASARTWPRPRTSSARCRCAPTLPARWRSWSRRSPTTRPTRTSTTGSGRRCACGRARDAVEHLRRARKLKPGDGNIELELALCLGRSGERDDALTHLRRRAERLRGLGLSRPGNWRSTLEEPHLALGYSSEPRGPDDAQGREGDEDACPGSRVDGVCPQGVRRGRGARWRRGRVAAGLRPR